MDIVLIRYVYFITVGKGLQGELTAFDKLSDHHTIADDGRNWRRFGAVFDVQKNTEDKSSLKILLFGSVFKHLKSFVLRFGEI